MINPKINLEHDDALVKDVNVHNHTKSCQKGGLGCRFDFPRLPSEETLIANPIADDELETEESKKKLEHSKQILKTVKDKLTELTDEEIELFNNDLKDFLQKLGIDSKDYHEALRISQRGKTIILKRKLKYLKRKKNLTKFTKLEQFFTSKD